MQEFGEGPGDLLGAVLDGAGATHPVQVLHVVRDGLTLVEHPDLERQALGPLGAGPGRDTPRVAVVLQVTQHHPGLAGERRFDHYLVAAHVDDVVDVLDVDRALLHTRAAVGARPQDVGVDDPALGLGADQWTVGLRLAGLGNPPETGLGDVVDGVLARGVLGDTGDRLRRLLSVSGSLGGEQVRRLGEQVVAKIHDQKLR